MLFCDSNNPLMIKKSILRFSILAIFCLSFANFQSCKSGEGCELEQKYQAKTDKDGNLSTKRGKSGLWSKKQKKKMRK